MAERGALRIDILTIFPEMLSGPLDYGVIARARAAGLIDLRVHNLRDWARDRHHTTDDYAFGGGGGMVMTPEPLFRAVEDLLGMAPLTAAAPQSPPCPVVLMTPQGRRLDHACAQVLAAEDRLVLVAGRYEGYDERVRQHLATHEVSLGDFVLTGGELPALIVADAVARLRPGVVGLSTATTTDSFAGGLLEHPHYTRPADFRGWTVPDVLVSGHHAEVERWRRRESLRRTLARRADLLAALDLAAEERRWLDECAHDPCDPPGDVRAASDTGRAPADAGTTA
jgi:tRNA (guanine37-N1)-methyltransferase